MVLWDAINYYYGHYFRELTHRKYRNGTGEICNAVINDAMHAQLYARFFLFDSN